MPVIVDVQVLGVAGDVAIGRCLRRFLGFPGAQEFVTREFSQWLAHFQDGDIRLRLTDPAYDEIILAIQVQHFVVIERYFEMGGPIQTRVRRKRSPRDLEFDTAVLDAADIPLIVSAPEIGRRLVTK